MPTELELKPETIKGLTLKKEVFLEKCKILKDSYKKFKAMYDDHLKPLAEELSDAWKEVCNQRCGCSLENEDGTVTDLCDTCDLDAPCSIVAVILDHFPF